MAILREVVRALRRKETPAERIFWNAVRNRRVEGRKFLRQFAIPVYVDNIHRFFVADFYCSEAGLIVEIDGAVHENRKEHDTLRTEVINLLGLRVIRFGNTEIETNLSAVLDRLRREIKA